MSRNRGRTRMAVWIDRARSLARAVERAVRPGATAWRGAALGVWLGIALVLVVLVFYRALRPTASWGKVLSTGMQLGAGLALAVCLLVGLWALRKLPARYRMALIFAAGLLGPLLGNLGDSPLALVLYVAAWSLVGAGMAVLGSRRYGELSRLRRAITVVGLLVGLAGLTSMFLFLADEGMEPVPVRNAAMEAETLPPTLELPDPSAPGTWSVGSLTYGSGEDHRPEYGRRVDLVTAPVDGSALLDNWDGRSGWAREQFWGFDDENLPLQGRVWFPEGAGRFPLVLIVHGNHSMEEYSDPGYAYLGELFASRGMIFVSVDENFINGSAGDALDGGLREENDARGWLLLEHLRQWRDWNGDPEHRFGGRVDLDRVALIGHSRGGEAVAVAAAFDPLPYYPDDATLEFDYGFGIDAVVAIAPVYGQYRPAGLLTPLGDVNYLTLHGANDGDVSSFAGARQFERVEFSGEPYRVKSTVYVHGANHGQFNSVWGDTDWGPPFSALLNTRALMDGEAQRQTAKVFISAFLEATLRDEVGYLPLFSDARVGRHWLPDTIYLTDFRDSRFASLADFDEDLDVTSATRPDARIEAEGLTRWREDRVSMKWSTRETNAVYLGWRHEDDDAAHYTLRFDAGLDASGARALVMSLADADESPAPRDDEGPNDEEADDGGEEHGANDPQRDASGSDEPDQDEDDDASDEDEPAEPIDLTVRLLDVEGRAAALPLSRLSAVQPQLPVETTKGVFQKPSRASEAVYQTFELPLAWFVEIEPELDLSRLSALELLFDRSSEGVLIVDDIGLAPALSGDAASTADTGDSLPSSSR